MRELKLSNAASRRCRKFALSWARFLNTIRLGCKTGALRGDVAALTHNSVCIPRATVRIAQKTLSGFIETARSPIASIPCFSREAIVAPNGDWQLADLGRGHPVAKLAGSG